MPAWWLSTPKIRVLIGISLLLLLLSIIDGGEVIEQLKDADPVWVCIAAGCILLSTLLGCINMFLLVDAGSHTLSLGRFFYGYWFAWALGLVVPGGVGDMVAVSAWLKRYGFEWHTGMGKALLDKLISLFWVSGLALWGIADFVTSFSASPSPSPLSILMVVIAMIMALALAVKGEPGRKAIKFIGRTLSTVIATVKSRPKQVAINILLTPVKVMTLYLSYWCIFNALGLTELDPLKVIALAAAAGLVAYIPISFNGLGTVEAAGLLLFGSLSLPTEAVLVAYFLLRIMGMALAWLPVGVWWLLARN